MGSLFVKNVLIYVKPVNFLKLIVQAAKIIKYYQTHPVHRVIQVVRLVQAYNQMNVPHALINFS